MTLKQLRESRYLMQLEVAEKIKVTPATISNWESGKHQPDLRRIRQLAEVYAVTPDTVQQAVSDTQSQRDAEYHSDHWDTHGNPLIGITDEA